jgi:ABC-type uncharacterized transport system substrate-binding protein
VVVLGALLAPASWGDPTPTEENGPPRVAVVTSRRIPQYEEAVSGFRETLVASHPSVEIGTFDIDGDLSRGPQVARELRQGAYDIVLTVGTEAYRALAAAAQDIPIVVSMVYDPEREFDLDATGHPNVYGTSLRVSVSAQLRALARFCPDVNRVSVIYMEGATIAPRPDEVSEAASLGFRLVPVGIGDLSELEDALDRARAGSDAFLMVLDPRIYTPTTTQQMLLYFLRARMPVVSFSPNFVKAGALLGISSRYRDNGAAAARLTAEILSGRPVTDRFRDTPNPRLDWNERAANALGLSLSDENRKLIMKIH